MSAAPKLNISLPEGKNPYNNDSYLYLMKKVPITPIRSKVQYNFFLKTLESVMTYKITKQAQLSPETREGIETYIRHLSLVIKEYEEAHYKFEKLSQGEILQQLMEMNGLTQNDLKEDLGGQSSVSKIINGTRSLSSSQIKRLAERFNVSPSLFF